MNQIRIHQLLKMFRQGMHLTQKEVAHEMGYSDSSLVSRYETGAEFPTPDYIYKFINSKKLGLDEEQKAIIRETYDMETKKRGATPLAEPAQLPHDLGIVFPHSRFTGREAELEQLSEWIHECHLVAVLGMGGIGKTTLIRNLVAKVKRDFKYIIWRSLDNAAPLIEVLADLLRNCDGPKKLDTIEREK